MTAQPTPPPVFRSWDNQANPLVGGQLFSYVAGTSTPQATYTDSTQTTQNTNPVILNARGEAQVWLSPNIAYKLVLQDANGNLIWTVDQVYGPVTLAALIALLTQAYLGQILFPQTLVEISKNVVPTNYAFQFGDLRRYGGDPTGVADSSAAWQSALSVGLATIPAASTFKILTGAAVTGSVSILGQGSTSVLLCDGVIATITNGTGSVVDNFTMNNIAVPYVLTRNPNSWSTPVTTLSQSNTVLGYQPTTNDPEYASLLVTYPSIATQNVGSQLFFTGNATNIEVSRIYGRFVSILMYDTQYSSVHHCDFRGGKASAGIEFWNINNQVGEGNNGDDNRVIYASGSGVMMARNYDFSMSNNICMFNGVSGVETYQDVVAGVDARCYKGRIENNTGSYNYYDGVDGLGSFGTSTPEARFMKMTGNYTFQNGGNGINIDGAFNEVSDNWVGFNQRYGIWGSGPAGLAFSSVINNQMYDNNQARNSSYHDISITGNAAYASPYSSGVGYTPGALVSQSGTAYRCLQITSGNAPPNPLYWVAESPGANRIAGNHVYAGVGQNNYGIYAPDTNSIGDNPLFNGAQAFYGNAGAISAIVEDVSDGPSGNITSQGFSLQISTTSGSVLQHLICSENGQAAVGLLSSRVIGASNVAANTPQVNSTTAFVNGGGVDAAATNHFVLNTLLQGTGYFDVSASVTFCKNAGSLALVCSPQLNSINVNGVQYQRLTLSFTVNGTGATYALTGSNIGASGLITVFIKGKIA